jgi:DNA processing protein
VSGVVEPAREVVRGSAGWPEPLDQLDVPPRSLWVRGTLPSPGAPCVAVVGSRRPSTAGLMIARDIGAELAGAGIVVVSGMARGIDGAAHRGALDARGTTLAVLGCGIELCYPPEHLELRERIVAGGCLISEDGGSAPPDTWRFPKRNRLIAALVEAVIVVEAGVKSGALSTARWAADLGREVLAVPGSIRNPTSAGANALIRDGARPYLVLADVFDTAPQLARALASRPEPAESMSRAGQAADHRAYGEDPLMRRVLDGLSTDPVHPDELAATLRVASTDLATALTMLQLRSAIREVCGGRVARTF